MAAVRLLNTIFSECSIITREKKDCNKEKQWKEVLFGLDCGTDRRCWVKSIGRKNLWLTDCDGQTDEWMDGRTDGRQTLCVDLKCRFLPSETSGSSLSRRRSQRGKKDFFFSRCDVHLKKKNSETFFPVWKWHPGFSFYVFIYLFFCPSTSSTKLANRVAAEEDNNTAPPRQQLLMCSRSLVDPPPQLNLLFSGSTLTRAPFPEKKKSAHSVTSDERCSLFLSSLPEPFIQSHFILISFELLEVFCLSQTS